MTLQPSCTRESWLSMLGNSGGIVTCSANVCRGGREGRSNVDPLSTVVFLLEGGRLWTGSLRSLALSLFVLQGGGFRVEGATQAG